MNDDGEMPRWVTRVDGLRGPDGIERIAAELLLLAKRMRAAQELGQPFSQTGGIVIHSESGSDSETQIFVISSDLRLELPE
ncbi:hypothetical protein [Pseudomonas citronellolis]|uniref:hypothetical protein n=1 Tax=Pseudomonas citronellolis TaxID=53408 RepID=UPI00248DA0A4|nr:hypothetical protein [Pseudomonas citronellolis]